MAAAASFASRCQLLAVSSLLLAACGGGVRESGAPPAPAQQQPQNDYALLEPPSLDYHRPITPLVADELGDLAKQLQAAPLKQLVEYAQNAREQLFDHLREPAEVLASSQLLAAECADALVLETLIDRDDGSLDVATHDQAREDLFDRYAELAFPDDMLDVADRNLDAEAAAGQPAEETKTQREYLTRLRALAAYARAGLYALGRDALLDKPRAHTLVRLAGDYRAQGQLDRAVAAYRLAVQLNPSPENELLLAEALYASGDVKGGDTFAGKPLPADASARAKELLHLVQLRKKAAALSGDDARSVEQRILLASALRRFGDASVGVKLADRLAARSPQDPASWAAVALAAWYDGRDPVETYRACQRGASVKPHAPLWLAVKMLAEMSLLRHASPAGVPASQPDYLAELAADARELGQLGHDEVSSIWPVLGTLDQMLSRGTASVSGDEGARLLARVRDVPRSVPSTYGLDMVQLYLELNGPSYRQAPTDFAAALPRLRKVASPADAGRLDGLAIEANLEVAVRDASGTALAEARKHIADVSADGTRTWALFYQAQASTAAWLVAQPGDRGAAAETALADLAQAAQEIAADTAMPESDQLSLLYPTMVNLMVLGTVQGRDVADKAAKLMAQTPLARYPEALLAEAFAAIHRGDKDGARQLLTLAAKGAPAVAFRAHRWLAKLAQEAGDAAHATQELAAAKEVVTSEGQGARYAWLDVFPSRLADAAFNSNIQLAYDLDADAAMPVSDLAVSESLILVPDADLGGPASAPAAKPSRRTAPKR